MRTRVLADTSDLSLGYISQVSLAFIWTHKRVDLDALTLYSEQSTESYDDMDPVGADTRWEVFRPFYDYLLQSFPLTCVMYSIPENQEWSIIRF